MDLRDLPSVDRLTGTIPAGLPRVLAVEIARAAIAAARSRIEAAEPADPERYAREAAQALLQARPTQVINATGVLLHTNLGRAPLDEEAAAAAHRAAAGYTNLELDLATGNRGKRGGYAHRLLTTLTGAEAAMVVNNNAGALYLALVALSAGGSVPVSRGELIEIGGSYRLPDLMAATGTRLVEIGTTNRTRLGDYRAAIGPDTALLLKVHPSNYRVSGFTDDASIDELAGLASESSLPLLFDVGSGLLDNRTPWLAGPPPEWLAGEPGIRQSLEAGADLVMFSGDKLLGGPQAGILVGRESLISRLDRHPVARALRVDGPTLAALTVTLERYADGSASRLPFWSMATASYADLETRCRQVAPTMPIVATSSTVGAGSVPGAEVPSPALAPPGSPDDGYLRLLSADPPVIGRRDKGRLLLDLRSVLPGQDETLGAVVASTWR
jgi:L-seryl-tRNA(Ser) seleniumtransferase